MCGHMYVCVCVCLCIHAELEMTGGHWSYSEQVDSLTDTLANHTAMMATSESSDKSKKFKRSLTRNYMMKMMSWKS